MPSFLKTVIVLFCICFYTQLIYAGPWFTGPILAAAGHNIPRGHTNLEIYGFDISTNGQYNSQGKVNHIPLFKSLVLNPLITHGYTDWLDIQLSIPYVFNHTQGRNYHRLADVSLGAGFQIFEQAKSNWLPDLRFYIQEIFPTGKYEELNVASLGADSTGIGSYRTLFALNFQHLKEVFNSHYLRTRFILSRLVSSSVDVRGVNAFGGTINTQGIISPGVQDHVDLAFEYTLTQNWVAVMEGYVSEGQSTHFNGILDIVDQGTATGILQGNFYEYGLAPAIEYNFNANVGIIGGVWFPVKGRNTSRYTTYVLALNAYW